MKVNKDVYVIDLGFKIPIYEHYIKRKINIEYWMAKDFLNNHLTNIANAYKQYDETIIETMLKSEAEKIQRIAKGSIVSNYCFFHTYGFISRKNGSAKRIVPRNCTATQRHDHFFLIKTCANCEEI